MFYRATGSSLINLRTHLWLFFLSVQLLQCLCVYMLVIPPSLSTLKGRVRSTREGSSEVDNQSIVLSLNVLNPHLFEADDSRCVCVCVCVCVFVCICLNLAFALTLPYYSYRGFAPQMLYSYCRTYYQLEAAWDSSLHNSILLNRYCTLL